MNEVPETEVHGGDDNLLKAAQAKLEEDLLALTSHVESGKAKLGTLPVHRPLRERLIGIRTRTKERIAEIHATK